MTKQLDVQPKSTEGDGKKKIVFADTDILSAFLKRGAFGYMLKVFETLDMEIIIPQQVVDELEYSPRTQALLAQPIHREAEKHTLAIMDIEIFTPEYDLYVEMTEKQRKGSGESAALSMAICSEDDAALASNNLRDVMDTAQKYEIELWTTARVFYTAEQKGIISRERASDLWKKMKKDGERLPFDTYEDYLQSAKCGR